MVLARVQKLILSKAGEHGLHNLYKYVGDINEKGQSKENSWWGKGKVEGRCK